MKEQQLLLALLLLNMMVSVYRPTSCDELQGEYGSFTCFALSRPNPVVAPLAPSCGRPSIWWRQNDICVAEASEDKGVLSFPYFMFRPSLLLGTPDEREEVASDVHGEVRVPDLKSSTAVSPTLLCPRTSLPRVAVPFFCIGNEMITL